MLVSASAMKELTLLQDHKSGYGRKAYGSGYSVETVINQDAVIPSCSKEAEFFRWFAA
jgi:hypothetical protein